MQDKMQGLYESIKSKIYEEEMLPTDEPENEAPPQVTPELSAELAATVGIEDIEQFTKGLTCSLAYYDAVSKQLDLLAKIIAINIEKIPDYYTRLEAMEAAYQAEQEEGSEEETEEEPVAVIDNEEIVAEESVQAPIDSKPSAATAITAESKLKKVKEANLPLPGSKLVCVSNDAYEFEKKFGWHNDSVIAIKKELQIGKTYTVKDTFIGELSGRPFVVLTELENGQAKSFPLSLFKTNNKNESKVKEGKLDYKSIDTGDTDANMKALTEKLAIAEKKINELNSLLAKGRGDEDPISDKPKADVPMNKLAPDGLGKSVVDKGEVSKPSVRIDAKDGKSLETEKGVEGLGNKEATKVKEPLKHKLGGPGYTPKY